MKRYTIVPMAKDKSDMLKFVARTEVKQSITEVLAWKDRHIFLKFVDINVTNPHKKILRTCRLLLE